MSIPGPDDYYRVLAVATNDKLPETQGGQGAQARTSGASAIGDGGGGDWYWDSDTMQWVAMPGSNASVLASFLESQGGFEGQSLTISGGSGALDGAGGVFVLASAGSDVHDGAMVFASATTGLLWKRIWSGSIKAEWFGAIPSNTDNAGALNAAAAWCSSHGKLTLRLKGGTYTCMSELDWENLSFTLQGDGTARTILKLGTGIVAIDVFVSIGGGSGMDISLNNLSIDASSKATSALRVVGAITIQSRPATGLQVSGGLTHNIDIQSGITSTVWTSVQLSGAQYGWHCDDTTRMSGVVIDRIRCSNGLSTGSAIKLLNPGGSSINAFTIREPIMEGNRGHAIDMQGGHLLRIQGGHFENNARDLADDADIILGRLGGGISLCMLSMSGTTFSSESSAQTTPQRIRFVEGGVRLHMRSCQMPASHKINGAFYSVASRIYGSQMPQAPTMMNFPQGNYRFDPLNASKTYDPGSIASMGTETTTVTVTGAVMGDIAKASFSLDLQGLMLTAYVSAANTVTTVLFNPTLSPVDLGSGTLRVQTENP